MSSSKFDSLLDGCDICVDPHISPNRPVWFNEDKFERGKRFFSKHVACVYFSMHMSLVAGFSIPSLLNALIFTQATDTPIKSLRRYVRTAYHIYLWLTDDIWDDAGDAARSLRLVHTMHKSVAASMHTAEADRMHVSQYDMALVQSGFFAAVFMYPRYFGIRCTRSELEAYAYAWRVIGWRLGIQDQFNICSGTYDEIYATCKDIEREVVIPHLVNPPADFHSIADVYIEGVNLPSRVRLQSKESVLAYVWHCFGAQNPQALSWADTARYYMFRVYVGVINWCPGFENFINRQVHTSMRRFGCTNIVTDIKKSKCE